MLCKYKRHDVLHTTTLEVIIFGAEDFEALVVWTIDKSENAKGGLVVVCILFVCLFDFVGWIDLCSNMFLVVF